MKNRRKRSPVWGKWENNLQCVPNPQRDYTVVAVVNRIYSARVYRTDNTHLATDSGSAYILSITRKDTGPIRGSHWLDIERIKNSIGFAEWWACEWYPPEDLVNDPAHVYYVYLWPPGHPIPESCNIEGVDGTVER